MKWVGKFRLWFNEDGSTLWSEKAVVDYISTEIIEKLIGEARESVRKCKSPDVVGDLAEAKLINRGDALDAIDQLRKDWL
jgi:hypothetical protein